jgi:hypothetical protein
VAALTVYDMIKAVDPAARLDDIHVVRKEGGKTGVWTQYVLPEPYGIDRKSWVDNSTTPVSIWYVDQEGYIARIQPLE